MEPFVLRLCCTFVWRTKSYLSLSSKDFIEWKGEEWNTYKIMKEGNLLQEEVVLRKFNFNLYFECKEEQRR